MQVCRASQKGQADLLGLRVGGLNLAGQGQQYPGPSSHGSHRIRSGHNELGPQEVLAGRGQWYSGPGGGKTWSSGHQKVGRPG